MKMAENVYPEKTQEFASVSHDAPHQLQLELIEQQSDSEWQCGRQVSRGLTICKENAGLVWLHICV